MKALYFFLLMLVVFCLGCARGEGVRIADRRNTPMQSAVGQNPPSITGVNPQGGVAGTEVQFSATATGDLPFSYSWDFGGGATPDTSTEASPTARLGAAGTYNASLTVTNSYGSDTFDLTLTVTLVSTNWQNETVDSGAEGVPSLAIDSSDNLHISYCKNSGMWHAKWDGSAWSTEAVDIAGTEGFSVTPLALDSNGYPHILHYDWWLSELEYARWDGSVWHLEAVLPITSDFSYYSLSLALDSSDNPRLAWFDPASVTLVYTAWEDSSWQIETVDDNPGAGYGCSLELDSSDNAVISYTEFYNSNNNSNLKIAWWDGVSWDISVVDNSGNIGGISSLELDSSDNACISYFGNDLFGISNSNLKFAQWDGAVWRVNTVDTVRGFGMNTSLALDTSGYPHISYCGGDESGVLKYATWDGSSWVIEVVDDTGIAGSPSIAIDSGDVPHISYCSSGTLKHAWPM